MISHYSILTTQYSFIESRSSAWLEHYTDNVGVTSSNLVGSTAKLSGGLAQLARASALHAEGHRFESDILHTGIGSAVRGKKVLLTCMDVALGLKVHNLDICKFPCGRLRSYGNKFFDILGKQVVDRKMKVVVTLQFQIF